MTDSTSDTSSDPFAQEIRSDIYAFFAPDVTLQTISDFVEIDEFKRVWNLSLKHKFPPGDRAWMLRQTARMFPDSTRGALKDEMRYFLNSPAGMSRWLTAMRPHITDFINQTITDIITAAAVLQYHGVPANPEFLTFVMLAGREPQALTHLQPEDIGPCLSAIGIFARPDWPIDDVFLGQLLRKGYESIVAFDIGPLRQSLAALSVLKGLNTGTAATGLSDFATAINIRLDILEKIDARRPDKTILDGTLPEQPRKPFAP